MHVLKFGGSILQKRRDFESLAGIIRSSASTSRTLVIVSALGRTTRELEQSCRSSLENFDMARQQCEALLQWTQQLASEILNSEEQLAGFREYLQSVETQLLQLLRGVSITHQLTARIRDKILAFGEQIALQFMHRYVNSAGIAAECIDAEHIIVSNAHFGAAQPLRRETHHNVARNLLPLFETNTVVLMQGFVARSENGDTTTMGRESSNLSAALMAQLLHADALTVYTNVNGIRSGDPSSIADSTLLTRLSYAQAHTLATSGVKLLYPTMIEPLRAAQIPMRICNLHEASSEYTLVSAQHSVEPMRVALLLSGLSLVQIQSRSLKANNQLLDEYLPKIVSSSSIHHVIRSAAGCSIVCDADQAAELLAALPDDCTSSRYDGIDLIRILHSPDFDLQSLLNACMHSETVGAIVRVGWCDTEGQSHVLCRSEKSRNLYQKLHSTLIGM